jgi:hypothetical protein
LLRFSGEPIPLRRFTVVLGDPPPIFIHVAEAELRLGDPLFGGEPIPFGRFAEVSRDAFPPFVHDAETQARNWFPPFG